MSMTIELSAEEEAAYKAHALAEGLTLEQWLRKVANDRVHPESVQQPMASQQSKLAAVCATVRGLADDLDFSRNPSTGRSVDL